MRENYQPEWFHWIYMESTRVGLICLKPCDQAFHLHWLVIEKDHRSRGYGKKVMCKIHDLARSQRKDITLSSFKCNKRAIKFYQSLNYEIIGEDEHFLFFRLSDENNKI